ncbi:MAG: response regulator transcription factor [Pseudomonadota bacterium]
MTNYAKILLVEDDIALADWINDYLKNEGFDVVHVERGDVVVDALKQDNFDLILLDIMLPGIGGIEVCKAIRTFDQTPIIMLTAKGNEIDEVIGLEVGANDYITKPVRPRALLARIKAGLRNSQSSNTQKDKLVFGTLTVDRAAKRVTLNEEVISLSTNLFEFLWLLADNAGRVVSRDEVFLKLKDREYDGLDRRFDVMVSTLRKLLRDNDKNNARIKTVWGQGYLFVADAWFE